MLGIINRMARRIGCSEPDNISLHQWNKKDHSVFNIGLAEFIMWRSIVRIIEHNETNYTSSCCRTKKKIFSIVGLKFVTR